MVARRAQRSQSVASSFEQNAQKEKLHELDGGRCLVTAL